jgi:23S rRNA (uracil1939-C5)-methyltransferase
MKQRPNNRSTPPHRPPTASKGKSSPVASNTNSRKSTHKKTKHRDPNHSNPGSTKIMRKAGFSGKLHRGPVVDAATDFASSCSVKDQCGACVFVNTNYADSLRAKFSRGLEALKLTGTLDQAQVLDPVPSPTPLAYRSYFKLAVRPATPAQMRQAEREGLSRRFAIGLFTPGTHQVSVDMSECPIHTKPLSNLIKSLQSDVELTTLSPWDEVTSLGDLRYVAARSSHLTGEIMITFVVATPQKQALIKLVNRLRRIGHKINSAHMNINAEKGNAIFGPETQLLAGTSTLRERICDLDIEVSPMAFFQANPWQANNLYRRVELHAGKGKPADVAWDLYTGTGQIALILARSGFRTLGIEEITSATDDAQRNSRRNNLQDRTSFLAARVEDSENLLPEWSKNPTVIVVNPSRRGLHEQARSHLAHVLRHLPNVKLIYVSCEAATLARDLKILTTSGHKVRQVEAFDMFAQTDKMEWVAVLTR